LPDPAELRAGDDFAAFMAREVPERLRRRALRALWRSNPVLACLDGLNDYDEDYRTAALSQRVFETSYQVGKGLSRHVEEMARKAAAAETAPDHDAVGECDDPQDTTVGVPEVVRAVAEPDPRPEPEETVAAPRRMRFRFDEAGA
jgi:hypothetical protein